VASNGVFDEIASRTARDWDNPSWWNLLITVPWMVGLGLCVYGFVTDQAIASRELTTYAIVRSHEPADHNQYGYEFSVDGRVFTGSQSPITELEIGQRVLVYYDPLDPGKSSLESFTDATEQAVGPATFLSAGVAGVAIFIFLRRRWHARAGLQRRVG
jgi:hypothetical protein